MISNLLSRTDFAPLRPVRGQATASRQFYASVNLWNDKELIVRTQNTVNLPNPKGGKG
jgi:hypothetical protein